MSLCWVRIQLRRSLHLAVLCPYSFNLCPMSSNLWHFLSNHHWDIWKVFCRMSLNLSLHHAFSWLTQGVHFWKEYHRGMLSFLLHQTKHYMILICHVKLTVIIWLRLWLLGFSTVELLFSLFNVNVSHREILWKHANIPFLIIHSCTTFKPSDDSYLWRLFLWHFPKDDFLFILFLLHLWIRILQ